MNKKIRILALSVSLSVLTSIFSSGLVANASEGNQAFNSSNNRIEQSQVQGRLVGKNTVFLKVSLKESAKDKDEESRTIDDVIIQKSNEKDFNKEKEASKISKKINSKIRVKRSGTSYWEDSDEDRSVVKIELAVYQNADSKSKFTAVQTFEWARTPIIPTTDAFGLRVSPGMIIHKSGLSGSAIGINRYGKRTNLMTSSIKCTDMGAGYSLRPWGEADNGNGYRTIEGRIQSLISFSQLDSGRQYGNIYGYYIRTSLGGSLSIDATGMPSIGFEMINNDLQTSVTVNNFGE